MAQGPNPHEATVGYDVHLVHACSIVSAPFTRINRWRFMYVLLRLSVAFLQIGGVMDNVAERTLALAAFVFVGSGLINSAIYLSLMLNMDSVEFRNRWMEVC